ncbi:MAG: hypothetical protein EOO08_12765 [Chitinophagaceae bacterium]|nr:MAG: hypothetical protein EOO08_12765 [Chitinophagaceae bacterium]
MVFLSFKWLLPVLASFFHPFYISVTEITHNAREKQVEVSCKLFAEDLEEVLRRGGSKTLDLGADAQHAQNDKLVAAYVQKNLSLSIDGRPQQLHYLGFEKDKEAVYCYFEVAAVTAAPRKVDVQNSLLYDFSDKEINLVHVVVNGKRQSTKLDYPKKDVSFQF